MTGFKYEGSDVKKISEQLLGLADLLDGRPPSEKALLLGFLALKTKSPHGRLSLRLPTGQRGTAKCRHRPTS